MQTIENQNIEEKREKQREEMNRKQNKKAYVFNVFMLIVLLVILTSAFIILKGKYDKLKDQSEDDNKEFGKIAIFRYYEEGERIQFFYDQAMKYAVEDALYSFANAGGYYAAECGFYNGTNLWHSNGQDCIPKIDENFAGFLGESLNKYAKGYLPKDYTVELPKTFTVQSSGEYVIAKANEDLMITKSKGTPELIGAEPQIPAQQASFSGTFEWPTDGKTVLHCFGMRSATRPHEGVDIDTENGPVKSPIFAAAAGEITAVKTGCVVGDGNCGNQGTDCGRGYGNCVYIKHSNELGTKYAHLTDVSVKIGDFVEQGQQIGTGGNTGHSFGDHLHYEVRYNGEAKNPLCMYQNTKDGINLLSGGNPRCYKDKSFTGSCPPAVSNDCGNEAVRLARQKIGSAYDYNSNFVKDTNTQVFSCSSFVYWSYAQMGIEMPVGGSRSIEEAIWGRDSGYAIGKIGLNANFNDDFNKLQPGDVLFFAGKIPHKDQGLEIGHVGIYTGDGNMIDANVPEVKEGPLGASRKGSLYRGAIRPCLAKPDAKAQITTQSTVQNLNPSAAGAVGGNPAGEAIKNEAKKILDAGTKYVYCGRTAAGVDCLGLPYLAMKNAGLIGDDSKTKTLFSEGYGVYYTYGEPVTAGALTSSSGESDAEIHHEIQKDELDYLQPGDILFFTSTGDRLFTPGSPTVARMIGRDKVLNIGHLGVYYGKKDDKCHEYMEASGILNDGAQCGACNGGDCKVVKKCLETRMGWKDGKRHVFATRIGGTVALSAAQPESKLVILDITNVSETSPLDAGARANLVDDFSKKLEATLKTSGVSVAVIDKSADELMDYADKNFENDSEGKKNVYESLGINGDVYVKISATEKGEFVASYKVKDVTAYNKNLALVGAIIKTYKTKVLENSQPIHSRVLSKNIPAIEIGVQSGNTDKLLTAAATEILKIFQIQGTKVAIQPTGDPLYKRGLITKYYTAVEEDFSSWGAFASSVKMQGSGLTKDRKLCRYTTVAQGPGSCVDDPKHPAGITASGTNPTPHRTIAVDRSYKGKTFFLDFMPYCNSNFNQELCKEWTGCYLGEDVGAASVIKGDHFDLYTGIGKTELNAVWGQIPDAADIYETNCEPGTGSMGAVVSSADAPLAGDAAVKGTEDILYTIRPAMKEKVLFNFEAIGDFEEEINILKETVSKCLGETATYEDIDACTKDKDIKDAGITKLQITEKEHTTSGFLIGLDATLNYKPKYHTEPLAIKMGVMLKDEYKPKESEVKLEKAEKTGMVTFSLTKSVSKDVQKYKITYKIKKKDDTDWPKKSSDLVEIPQDKMPGKLVIPNDVPTKPDEGNDFNWAANKANVTLSQGDEIELTIVAIDDSELSSEVSDKSRIQAAIPAE